MAVYIQATFIVVSAGFWIFAGDGRYAEGLESPSLIFLLRAWVLPEGIDVWLLTGLGMTSAIIGYCISQAYRLAEAATVAPFEYTGLPLAILWGWLIWGDLPGWEVLGGIILITGAGLFVFVREQQKKRPVVSGKRVHRRY
jgi:S-adenosylmethionine uptake transporter